MEKKLVVGGQAVVEGVMMRGPKAIATAVRKQDGSIVYKKIALNEKNNKWLKVPFVRGVLALYDAMVVGTKELIFASNQAGLEEEKMNDKEIKGTVAISILLGVGLFMVLPSFIGSHVFRENRLLANVLEAAIRLVLFLGYIWGISFFKDIKRVFEYHGAEHKSIYTYENGLELTPENAKKFTTLHPRCGTSFLFIVMFIAIIVFSVIDFMLPIPTNLFTKFLLKVVVRILLMPVIASLAYELQKYSSCHLNNPLIKLISFPGLALQKITTREPDLDELEVAMVAIKASLGQEINNATEVFE